MLRIDTTAIRETAAEIARQNGRLEETLNQCQQTVHSLANSWTGAAAEATIDAFDSFAARYFDQYKEMLDQYVQFLNSSAGAGYEETEQRVARKADEI